MISKHSRFCLVIVVALSITMAARCQTSTSNFAYPSDIAGWNESIKIKQRSDGEKLIADLKNAVESGVATFVIKPGHYRFSQQLLQSPISINNAHNLQIIAKDVTFWIENTAATVFRIYNAKNLTITGLTIDYDPLPFTQGTIRKVLTDEKSLIVDIDKGFPSPLSPGIYAATTTSSARVFVFNPEGNMRENIRDDYVKEFTELHDGSFSILFKGEYNFSAALSKYSPYKAGDKIVIPVGKGSLFSIQESEAVTFNQCNIYAAGGMSFSATYGKGRHVFNEVNIIPRPGTKRLLSSKADGIHVYNVDAGPVIKNCRIENLGDDAIAIHGFFGVAFKNNIASSVIEVTNPFKQAYRSGTKLELYDFRDMHFYDTVNIEKVEIINGKGVVERIENLRQTFQKEGNRVRDFSNKNIYRLTLNKAVILAGDALVVNDEGISAGFEVTGNKIRNIISRGILIKSHNGIIAGNDVQYTGQSGIALLSEAKYWLEGPFNKNIRVESNHVNNACISINSRLQQNALGAIAVEIEKDADFTGKYLNRDIIIRDNSVSNSGTSGISINSINEGEVSNNTISNSVQYAPFNNTNLYGIYIGSYNHFQFTNNVFKTVSPWQTDSLCCVMR